MAITNYAELQTSVAGWLHRSDLTAIIPDLITLGENRIFEELRVRQMETTLAGTTASGVLAVPSDYLEMKHVYLVSGGENRKLARTTAEKLYTDFPVRSADGAPKVIARDGANFVFGPFPDANYTIGGTYYAKLTTIASSVNALFTAAPQLYLWAALCEAEPYLQNDARVALWENKYQQAKARIEKLTADEELSGGMLMTRVG